MMCRHDEKRETLCFDSSYGAWPTDTPEGCLCIEGPQSQTGIIKGAGVRWGGGDYEGGWLYLVCDIKKYSSTAT